MAAPAVAMDNAKLVEERPAENETEDMREMSPSKDMNDPIGKKVISGIDNPVKKIKSPDSGYGSVEETTPNDSGENSSHTTPSDSPKPSGQTTPSTESSEKSSELTTPEEFEESEAKFKTLSENGDLHELPDHHLVEMVVRGLIQGHSLENLLGDETRAVSIRREVISKHTANVRNSGFNLDLLPYEQYDYSTIAGRCAENVVGYVPIPAGIAGPLLVDGEWVHIPMATTEGTLVASTSRGAKVLNTAGGVQTALVGEGMTRAPAIEFPNIKEAARAQQYIESAEGRATIESTFNSTTSYGHLESVTVKLAGRKMFLRFKASTGEAMGMNMLGKGVQECLTFLSTLEIFKNMHILALSGNMCTDKKPAAINWIEGRGRSIVAEALISNDELQSKLKCSAKQLVDVSIGKNLVGSALAGMSAGGFNAQAANIVAAIFNATGQDPAQVVESSNCMTQMEVIDDKLQISVTMPSIEVGTIGGGTHLGAQKALLNLVGVTESGRANGANANKLASVVAGAVLAAELSLCSALTTGDLIKAHMKLNRK